MQQPLQQPEMAHLQNRSLQTQPDQRIAEIAQTIAAEEVKNKQLALQMQQLQAEKQRVLEHAQLQLQAQQEALKAQAARTDLQLSENESLKLKLHGAALQLQSGADISASLQQQLADSREQLRLEAAAHQKATAEAADFQSRFQYAQQALQVMQTEKEQLSQQLARAQLQQQQNEVSQHQLQQAINYQKELRASLQAAVAENTDLVQKYNTLLAAHKSTQGELRCAQEEATLAKQQKMLLQSRVTEQSASLNEAEDRGRLQRAETERLERRAQAAEQKLSQSSADNIQLQKRQIELERDLQEMKMTTTQLKSDLQAAEAEKRSLQTEKSRLQSDLQKATEKAQQTELDLQNKTAAVTQLNSQIAALKQQVAQLEETEKKLSSVELQLRQSGLQRQADADDAAVQLSDANTHLQQMQKANSLLQNQLEMAVQRVKELESLENGRRAADAEALAQLQQFETQLKENQDKLYKTVLQNEALEGENKLLKDKLVQKEGLVRNIELQFQQLQAQGPVVLQDTQRIMQLEEQNRRADVQIKQLEAQLQGPTGRHEYELLRNDFEQMKQDKEFIEQFQLHDLKKENRMLVTQNNELLAQLEKLKIEAQTAPRSMLDSTVGDAQIKKTIRTLLRDDDKCQGNPFEDMDVMNALDQDPEHFLNIMASSKRRKSDRERLDDLKQKLWSIV